jgi:hypothetical protein
VDRIPDLFISYTFFVILIDKDIAEETDLLCCE